jgi:Tol biopolymer transport system component
VSGARVDPSRSALSARAVGCALAIAGSVSCGQLLGLADPVDAATSADGGDDATDRDATPAEAGDAAGDAGAAEGASACDPAKPFGVPTPVQGMGVNTAANEGTPRLSADQLNLYFWSDRGGDAAPYLTHIYVATRARATDPFDPPALLTPIDSTLDDDSPTLTTDGLTIVFGSDRRSNANGPDQLFMATRAKASLPFSPPGLLANVNEPYDEDTPYLRADGQALYFASDRPGGQGGTDLVRTNMQPDGTFAVAAFVTELNTPAGEYNPCVSADETTILWGSDRTDLASHGDYDIYVAQRPSATQGFTSIANAGDAVNSSALDLPGWLSPDGCTLYLESTRGGAGRDLYVARRAP